MCGSWPAIGAVSLHMDARISSVSGALGGGPPCIPSRAGLVVAPELTSSSAVAGCGWLASPAAPSVRSSCTTTGGSSAVCAVPCPPASVCPVPSVVWTAHVSASGWLVTCGQGAPPAACAVPGEAGALPGRGTLGPQGRCGGRCHPWPWMVSAVSPACAPGIGCWGSLGLSSSMFCRPVPGVSLLNLLKFFCSSVS